MLNAASSISPAKFAIQRDLLCKWLPNSSCQSSDCAQALNIKQMLCTATLMCSLKKILLQSGFLDLRSLVIVVKIWECCLWLKEGCRVSWGQHVAVNSAGVRAPVSW